MIKAVIFDMDGVIIDSEPIYQMWLEEFLEYQGISVPESELRTIPGISTQAFKEKVEKWWKCCGVTNKTGEEINREFDNFCKDKKISYKNIASPYLKQTLEHLKIAEIKMAIASSSPLKTINQVTSEIGIDHYFDVKVSGEAFKHSKPNPEIYLHTADKLQINVNQCVAVEDSTYGIRAALNAKIKVIAKKDDRYGYDQTLADFIIENLNELPEVINKMSKKSTFIT